MHSKLNHFSGAHCLREHPGVIERHGDNVLVVHDIPAGPPLKTLLWVVASTIPVIAVLGVFVTLHIAAVVMAVLVVFASAVAVARRSRAEIDLEARKIAITQEVFALARRRTYALGDYSTVEIQARPRLLEGYALPFFFVRLVGSGKPIALYSTDDAKEANAVKEEIAGFLTKAGASTQLYQSDKISADA